MTRDGEAPSRDGSLGYRSYPAVVLWDYQGYEFVSYGGPGIEVGVGRRMDTKSSTTKHSITAEKRRELPVDNLRQAFASRAGVMSSGAHYRGGRAGEVKYGYQVVQSALALPPPPDGPPSGPDLSRISPRTNLNETAFFFPHLIADRNGEVRIEFTMPEALTEWRVLPLPPHPPPRGGPLAGRAHPPPQGLV